MRSMTAVHCFTDLKLIVVLLRYHLCAISVPVPPRYPYPRSSAKSVPFDEIVANPSNLKQGRYALRWASDQDMEPLAPSPHRLSHPADELPPPVTRPRLRLVLPRCMDLHDVGSDQRAWPQRWGEGSLLPSQGRTERTAAPPPIFTDAHIGGATGRAS